MGTARDNAETYWPIASFKPTKPRWICRRRPAQRICLPVRLLASISNPIFKGTCQKYKISVKNVSPRETGHGAVHRGLRIDQGDIHIETVTLTAREQS